MKNKIIVSLSFVIPLVIYFVLCVVINYYFMLNLIVAVLLYNFSRARQQDLLVCVENSNLSTRTHKNKHDRKRNNKISINMNIKLDNYNEQAMKKKYQRKYTPIDLDKRRKKIQVKSLFTAKFFSKFKRIRFN